MKFKITKETVGNIAKVGGLAMLYGLAVMGSKVSINDMIDKIRYSGDVSYSDAFDAIMDSSMLDSYKQAAMRLLKHDGDSEYYKAVIKIIKSSMLGSYKIESITNLNNGEIQ